jgi:hypothetical protein
MGVYIKQYNQGLETKVPVKVNSKCSHTDYTVTSNFDDGYNAQVIGFCATCKSCGAYRHEDDPEWVLTETVEACNE